jgi:hypothetical protein
MNCREIEIQLLQLFDEESLTNLSGELQDHLKACRSCQWELGRLMKLQQELEKIPLPSPDTTFWQNYLPKLHWRMEESQRHQRKSYTWIPSLAASMVFVMLLLKTPVQIAPPGWVNDVTVSSWHIIASISPSNELSKSETESLQKALQDTSVIKAVLGEESAALAVTMSQPTTYKSDNLIDKLSTLEDDAIVQILEELKQKSISHS